MRRTTEQKPGHITSGHITLRPTIPWDAMQKQVRITLRPTDSWDAMQNNARIALRPTRARSHSRHATKTTRTNRHFPTIPPEHSLDARCDTSEAVGRNAKTGPNHTASHRFVGRNAKQHPLRIPSHWRGAGSVTWRGYGHRERVAPRDHLMKNLVLQRFRHPGHRERSLPVTAPCDAENKHHRQ